MWPYAYTSGKDHLWYYFVHMQSVGFTLRIAPIIAMMYVDGCSLQIFGFLLASKWCNDLLKVTLLLNLDVCIL